MRLSIRSRVIIDNNINIEILFMLKYNQSITKTGTKNKHRVFEVEKNKTIILGQMCRKLLRRHKRFTMNNLWTEIKYWFPWFYKPTHNMGLHCHCSILSEWLGCLRTILYHSCDRCRSVVSMHFKFRVQMMISRTLLQRIR